MRGPRSTEGPGPENLPGESQVAQTWTSTGHLETREVNMKGKSPQDTVQVTAKSENVASGGSGRKYDQNTPTWPLTLMLGQLPLPAQVKALCLMVRS